MKTANLLSAIGLASVLLSFNAGAASYQDIDVFNELLNAGNTSVSGSFNIAGGDGDVGDIWGYTPSSQTIIGGTVWFSFLNTDLEVKKVSITLSGDDFVTPNTTLSLGTPVVFGSLISGQLYLDLDATGIANYTVTRSSGEFTFVKAELFAESDARAQIPVPDTGTSLALLGLSLIGLGVFSKTSKRKLV